MSFRRSLCIHHVSTCHLCKRIISCSKEHVLFQDNKSHLVQTWLIPTKAGLKPEARKQPNTYRRPSSTAITNTSLAQRHSKTKFGSRLEWQKNPQQNLGPFWQKLNNTRKNTGLSVYTAIEIPKTLTISPPLVKKWECPTRGILKGLTVSPTSVKKSKAEPNKTKKYTYRNHLLKITLPPLGPIPQAPRGHLSDLEECHARTDLPNGG